VSGEVYGDWPIPGGGFHVTYGFFLKYIYFFFVDSTDLQPAGLLTSTAPLHTRRRYKLPGR